MPVATDTSQMAAGFSVWPARAAITPA
jgi:hypothetical protein